ncbi:MAG: FKBP-type peptidyl-prolyl cis-trans isomerase [Flavobacteriales bacterium]|nr:FKBP-type peptidyl-prolyl cis-trans isomerase [Flavobacteriales bacterium]
MKFSLTLLTLCIAFASCKKVDPEEQAATDETIIQQYLSDHSLTSSVSATGLHYIIEELGSGASCNSNSSVRVSYRGYYTDGTVFDESPLQGIEFGLQQVIKGWTEGIPYFKEGGNGVLLIPSALAYGENGSGSVPPNTVLIFDVALLQVL